MKHGKALLATGLLLGLNTFTAQANLQSRAGGTMIYDADLNITWLADANLFKTLADTSGNANDYVQSIIAANSGVVYDTANFLDGKDGIYNLNISDFSISTGQMTWFAAQAWASSLIYGGYNDWHLPTTIPPLSGSNQSGSEMGHMFYSELGGTSGTSITIKHNPNYNLFSNIQSWGYWSSSEFIPDPQFAWSFFRDGSQWDTKKWIFYNAWAVRDGDVATVPVPGAIWLFGSSFIGLLALKRRSLLS